jgi:hypothetical protein
MSVLSTAISMGIPIPELPMPEGVRIVTPGSLDLDFTNPIQIKIGGFGSRFTLDNENLFHYLVTLILNENRYIFVQQNPFLEFYIAKYGDVGVRFQSFDLIEIMNQHIRDRETELQRLIENELK